MSQPSGICALLMKMSGVSKPKKSMQTERLSIQEFFDDEAGKLAWIPDGPEYPFAPSRTTVFSRIHQGIISTLRKPFEQLSEAHPVVDKFFHGDTELEYLPKFSIMDPEVLHDGPPVDNSRVLSDASIWAASPMEKKGYGAFVMKPTGFKTGDIILVESPLMLIDWELSKRGKFNSNKVPAGLMEAYNKLNPGDKILYDDLIKSKSIKDRVFSIFRCNAFENVTKDPHRLPNGKWGIYTSAARFNTACIPNAWYATRPDGKLVIYAFKDIPFGAEILLIYSYRLTAGQVMKHYQFKCRCEECGGPRNGPGPRRLTGFDILKMVFFYFDLHGMSMG